VFSFNLHVVHADFLYILNAAHTTFNNIWWINQNWSI